MENLDKEELKKKYEEAYNNIFPGLQMFVRDTFLDKATEEKYVTGKIIREPTYCDVSCRVGGLVTTHRYAILSNRFVDFKDFEHGSNWGLFVCKRDSYFKILDVYKLNDKTQITLLHLDENWKLFENVKCNIDADIINMSQERFRNKIDTPPIPELATKRWLDRLSYPIGIDHKNEYFPLTGEISNIDNPETLKTIINMDSAIEKLLMIEKDEV